MSDGKDPYGPAGQQTGLVHLGRGTLASLPGHLGSPLPAYVRAGGRVVDSRMQIGWIRM